ncbi:hypothetical protein FHG87_018000 [Trinorchestia longiramus]|nr:hypothetical protein FHG87_018000 [Trinorchestia longiramus]
MSLPYGRAQLQLSTSVKGPLISSIKAQPDGVDSRFQCLVCSSRPDFAQSTSFKRHLRQHHCKVEGGSFVCLYGTNGVCASLPLEGVNATDYVQHVLRQHLQTRVPSFTGAASMTEQGSFAGAGHQSEEKWSIYSAVQNLPSALNDPKKGMTPLSAQAASIAQEERHRHGVLPNLCYGVCVSVMRDFFTRTWGETFTEVRSIPPHVALPQVLPRHVEGYGKRMRRRSKLLHSLQLPKPAPDDPWSPAAGESRFAGLASIPTLFFSPNFSLEDPVTFYSVFKHLAPSGGERTSSSMSPLTGGAGGASGSSSPVTNIQEKV